MIHATSRADGSTTSRISASASVEPEQVGDRGLLLERESIGAAARDAMQRDADVEQPVARVAEVAQVVGRGYVRRAVSRPANPRGTEGAAGPRQRVQVAQSAAAVLEVGLEHLRDEARSQAPELGGVGQLRQHARAAPRRELATLRRRDRR